MMLSVAGRLTAPLLAAAAFCAAGCASLDPPAPERPGRPDRPERQPPVAITVEEVPADGGWHVYYALAAPARGLELLRIGAPFRRDLWGVAVAGGEASWGIVGGRERLCFSRPAQVVSVSFRSPSAPLSEELGPALAWSDGSRVLDTGHILARPLEACEGEEASAPPGEPPFRFTLRAAPGRSVRLPGAAAAGELRWEPAAGAAEAATWVYFGDVQPTGGGTVLLDLGLPGRPRAALAEALPRLARGLGGGTERPYAAPPMLLVAWGGDGGPGASFATAARPGVAVAWLRGSGWAEGSPGAWRDGVEGIALGLFHARALAAPSPGRESAWLVEAAAARIAAGAAAAAGAGDGTDTGRRLVTRANDCLVRLGGRSLVAAAEADPGARASCGAVAMAAADGALRRGAPPSDLAALFGRLFEHAAAAGAYDERTFVGGLQELGAEPRAVADVRWLLRGNGSAEGDRFLQRLLAHAGVAVERVAPDEVSDGLVDEGTVAAMVARAVGRCYCGAGEAASCDPAVTGREASVLAGEPIAADPRAAWARLRSSIARGAALPVTVAGEETTLFCTGDAFDPTWTTLLAPAAP